MLAGWGLFNLVEGTIDHLILKLHNVREFSASPEAWNYGFLALGLAQVAGGLGLMRIGAGTPRARADRAGA